MHPALLFTKYNNANMASWNYVGTTVFNFPRKFENCLKYFSDFQIGPLGC